MAVEGEKREGKLFAHTVMLGAGSAASKIITFLLLPVYTAALTPAEFGTADIVVSTAVLLLPIVSLRAPEALFRFRAGGEQGAFGTGLIFLAVGFVLFAALLPLFGLSAVLRPYFGLLFCYVAASILRSYLAHTLRADGAFGLYALQQVFCAVLTALLQILFLAVLRRGVAGYLTAVILSDAATFLILAVCLFDRWRHFGRVRRELSRKMLRFSLPLIPTAVLWWVMAASDRYFILRFSGESATGLYAAAGRLPALLSFLTGVFLEAWHYAVLRVEKERQGELYGRIYALYLPALIGFGAALSILAKPLVSLFLAPQYASASIYVPLLLFGALCGGLSHFFDSIYTLRYSTVASFVTALIAAVCNLALNFTLIPRLGALGAALSTAVSYALLFSIRLWHTKRYLDFPRLVLPLALSLSALFIAAVQFGQKQTRPAVLFCCLAVLAVSRQTVSALRFLARRARILLKNLQKKGISRKKI